MNDKPDAAGGLNLTNQELLGAEAPTSCSCQLNERRRVGGVCDDLDSDKTETEVLMLTLETFCLDHEVLG